MSGMPQNLNPGTFPTRYAQYPSPQVWNVLVIEGVPNTQVTKSRTCSRGYASSGSLERRESCPPQTYTLDSSPCRLHTRTCRLSPIRDLLLTMDMAKLCGGHAVALCIITMYSTMDKIIVHYHNVFHNGQDLALSQDKRLHHHCVVLGLFDSDFPRNLHPKLEGNQSQWDPTQHSDDASACLDSDFPKRLS